MNIFCFGKICEASDCTELDTKTFLPSFFWSSVGSRSVELNNLDFLHLTLK